MGDDFKFIVIALLAGMTYYAMKIYGRGDTSLTPVENNPGTFQGSVQPGQKYYTRTNLDPRADQGALANQPWASEIFNNLPTLVSDKPGDNSYSQVQDIWDSLNVDAKTGRPIGYYSGGVGN